MEAISAILGIAAPMAQAERHHLADLKLASQLHNEAIAQELMHFNVEMNFDIRAAMREHSRDILEARAKEADTLIIVDTVMFTAGFVIVSQAIMPQDTSAGVLIAYACMLAFAQSAMCASIWLAIRLQVRMGQYNIFRFDEEVYFCGKRHPTFMSYYNCHCRQLAVWAGWLLYFGTLTLLVGLSLFAYATFMLSFSLTESGIVFVVIGAATVLVIIVLFTCVPGTTRKAPPDDDIPSIEQQMHRFGAKVGVTAPVPPGLRQRIVVAPEEVQASVDGAAAAQR